MSTTLEQAAYSAGWMCVMSGADPRYCNPFDRKAMPKSNYAWDHGALDAMEAEDGEEPDPKSAGY